MYLDYLTDPTYGWSKQCWDRFGDHPAQVSSTNGIRPCTPKAAIDAPRKRPYTRDEIQDLFDCADDRVVRIHHSGSKGWVPTFRIATILKATCAWGLRRNEVRQLDLVDLASPRTLDLVSSAMPNIVTTQCTAWKAS